jgi:hypothetical protein
MAPTTSTTATVRHGLSATAAALLTIGGNILVVAIAAAALAGVVLAAIAVFGPQLIESL